VQEELSKPAAEETGASGEEEVLVAEFALEGRGLVEGEVKICAGQGLMRHDRISPFLLDVHLSYERSRSEKVVMCRCMAKSLLSNK
jgi:hypothetical protein